MERIQKILANCGLASRRKAEEYISQGKVTVNGRVASLGDSADLAADVITLNGKKVEPVKQLLYYMINKPRGYVCTVSDERDRKTVLDIVGREQKLYPVGRLDINSEGLLLLTNDGELTNKLTHPRHQVEKTYHLIVEKSTENPAQLLGNLTEIDGEAINKAKVSVLKSGVDRSLLSITINQGKNRQIRRMCDSVGLRVLRLKRVSVAGLKLGGLKTGQFRPLTAQEVDYLKNL